MTLTAAERAKLVDDLPLLPTVAMTPLPLPARITDRSEARDELNRA
ncbi:hypothetical protein [Bradyrhizobium sp. 162]|nr:hypothetical protein [Bradyrhizobium sp. 162]MCK1629242.1 hypothetical protein [Bradyrhizobium sp. 162]